MSEEPTYNQSNLTQGLFWESCTVEKREEYQPKFTLKLRDWNGCKSAYQIYMESCTEDTAALQICENLHHWDKLISSKWFMEGGMAPAQGHLGLKKWREHKERLDRSLMLGALKKEAKNGSASAATAYLKHLQTTDEKGRPKKPDLGEDLDKVRLQEQAKEFKKIIEEN